MKHSIAALVLALSGTLAACGGGGGGSGPVPGPTGGGGATPTPAPVTSNTIGEALPSGMGTITTSFGVVGGFTQKSFSQVLAFPPGTKVTIKNLAPSEAHTLNVLSTTGFPANPALSTTASGGTNLAAGWASGSIPGGGSVTVTLNTPGTYYIGCAFHYLSNQMRDVLEVSSSATPGPQATPPAGGSGGGGCTGTIASDQPD